MELNGFSDDNGMEGDPDLQHLLTGNYLYKVKSNSWKKARYFKLLSDCKTIWQESQKPLKKKSSQTFSIEDIEDVRVGRQSEGLKKYTNESLEEQCFSIVFKGQQSNLDLIAPSVEDAKQWVSGLDKIKNYFSHNMSSQQKRKHWLLSCMKEADKDNDNMMTLKELKHFLKNVNISVDDNYAKQLFIQCDTSQSGTLEGSEILEFYKRLTQRDEIDTIYAKYATSDGKMSVEDLVNFLQNEQREPVSENVAHSLIEQYEVDENAKQNEHMTKDGFLMYLNSQQGMIFNPEHYTVYQDMTQPLNHYFISSSHNTYLMEDQLKGPSSTEAYIKALVKGCRCVELDCWDGHDGEPVIYHGYTLTSKILFRDVIKAISQYAFKTSEYPVILSLENHCTVEQQNKMASHLWSILGDALLTEPLGDGVPMNFPSPEQLKGKILIKGKRLNKLEHRLSNGPSVDEEMVSEEDEAEDAVADAEKKKKKPKGSKIKLSMALSDVVIYCKSVHFSGFENAMKNQSFYEMSSFKEGKAIKLAQDSGNAFVRHNNKQLSRIYPAGSRTDSSNYNPVELWNAGCQIVALNFQTPGKEMDINQGRFMQNGFSGYNLKPKFLRDPNTDFDPSHPSQGEWMNPKSLHIMVISAQQLPKVNKEKLNSIVDPLVKMEIFGVLRDCAAKETKHIDNNGFNPMWNEKFTFKVYVPDLAIVRFLVEDYDHASHNDMIGQFTLPFNSLQMGYRHIPLIKKSGELLSSASLFVHIMVTD
ncbi:1-phosphatidylinositol 4,5-bisphosphate phosphodiesterase delta-1a isoform X2 [Amia ocellicauda]|uniref:1-phosphatidylinositol 4,5-bisphosphate phosphodiesterase delta-1a isoform X2 n=1 Tax=Amia ocellicauda TaxID=2972642 RepID=UPI00346431B7